MNFGVRRISCVLALGLVPLSPGAAETLPSWAFTLTPPGYEAEKDDGRLRRVPDSTQTRTLTQVRDPFDAPDWHPDEHPPAPNIVVRGRKPDVMACAYCHLASGSGGPESANLTGLSVDYITQQMAEFRSGARRSSEPRQEAHSLMVQVARAVTDDEGLAAAQFFAGLPYRSMVDVVETDAAPKTQVMSSHLAVVPGGGSEPLGERIIEVPADLDRFVSRDPRVRFIAYVPPGSIENGQILATTGGDRKTSRCALCHGADLKGAGMIPPIVGRSPTYTVRQLWDFRAGRREGTFSVLMKQATEKLTLNDMIALAAYLASVKP